MLERPKHKVARRKFDPETPECLLEKTTVLTTPEVQFRNDNLPWISSLRPINPVAKPTDALSEKKTEGEEEKALPVTVFNPPSFYEADLMGKEKRFEHGTKSRMEYKGLMKKRG